jgi:TetR/AcrR family transcriptional regulator, transcriptional repressor of aconitase
MSPNVPKAYLEARRMEILEAAVKCFKEKGFHNTTMQDIYEATSLSPGAVYNYFGSKEDIISAAVEKAQERNLEAIAKAASGSPEEFLRNLGKLYFSCARNTDFVKEASVDFALYSEANHNQRIHEALRKNQDAVITRLVELVKLNQGEGIFSASLDAAAIARILFSILAGSELHVALNPGFDMDSYAAVFESIINGTFSKPRKRSKRVPKSGNKRESEIKF